MGSLPLHDSHAINTTDELESLYHKPRWVAFAGEIDHINAQYRAFIDSAPFVTIATNGPKGMDCSARGGDPGFVRIRDERTLILPDRAGNNRVDSLRNIIHDARIALLFLIPGCYETLRIKGRAIVSQELDFIRLFSKPGDKPPKTVLAISVESVHFQCAGAVKRARLWDEARQQAGEKLPSPNGILAGIKWQGVCRALGLRT
jgi:PPOX class probable FMN-dependent enzyme